MSEIEIDNTTGLEQELAHVAISPVKVSLDTQGETSAIEDTILEEVSEAEDEETSPKVDDVETVEEVSEAVATETATNSAALVEVFKSTVENGESALISDIKKLKQAIAEEGLPVSAEEAQNAPDDATSPNTKLNKGQKKNRKNAQKKAEQVNEGRGNADTAREGDTTAETKTAVKEIPSPEEQHKLARQKKSPKKDAPRAIDSSQEVVVEPTAEHNDASGTAKDVSLAETGEGQKKKKKMGSQQRRALRDARLAAAAEEGGEGEKGGAPEAVTSHSPDTVAQATHVPAESTAEEGQTKSKRQRNRANKADSSTQQAAAPATAETPAAQQKEGGEKESKDSVPTPTPATAEGTTGIQEKEKRKKPSSSERRARKDALLAAESASVPTPAAAAAAAPQATPTSAVINGKKATNAAAAAPAAATVASAPQAPVPALSQVAPKAGKATSAATTVPAVTAPTTTVAAPTTVAAAATVKLTAPSTEQRILIHSAVTVLLQTLRAGDSLVYTQHGALKTHLLTELVKLGYVGIEGNAAAFQKIVFLPQGLSYSDPIKHAAQFPPLKVRGDVKIEQPNVCLQVKCYPAFGADSPKMAGLKAFKNGFLKPFDEVALAETDVYLFVLSAEVYQEYALQAAPCLPVLSDIANFSRPHRLAYVTKKELSCKLNSVVCKIDTGYGEFVVGAIHA